MTKATENEGSGCTEFRKFTRGSMEGVQYLAGEGEPLEKDQCAICRKKGH